MYGHNAIRIVDDRFKTDLVYNYGTFDFRTKGFVVKFMRGKLPYRLEVAEYERFLVEYDYLQRSVPEQVLNVDSIQKQKIISFLAHNMLPENRTYKYDFFRDNCAPRLRDIIERNVVDCHWQEDVGSQKTFRDIIKEYQQNMPWLDFGVDLIIGSPADKVASWRELSFIPDYLSSAKPLSRLSRSLLARDQVEALAGTKPPRSSDDRMLQNYLTEDGRLKAFPATLKKRRPILRWLARHFEEGRTYSEAEVNETIEPRHHDRETFRRELIAHKMLARKDGSYWRLPESGWVG